MSRSGARPRLIACDVDGTLITSAHRLAPATIAAVQRAVRAGVRFVLVTSRPPIAIRVLLEQLGLVGSGTSGEHPFVTCQGALVGSYSESGELRVRHQVPMPVELAQQVVATLPGGLAVNWYAGSRWLVGAIDALVEREAAIVGCEPELADLAGETIGPDKLLVLAPPARTHLLAEVTVPAGLMGVRSTATHLEVTRDGVDKAAALFGLCAELGIEPGEVAAIGDGANDLTMLSSVGTAVAMGNAMAEVREIADLTTTSNDEDGVARAVESLLRR